MPFGSQSKRRYMDFLKKNKLGMFSGGRVEDEDAPEDTQFGSFHPYDSSGEPNTNSDLEERKPMEFMSQGGTAGRYDDSEEDDLDEDEEDQESPDMPGNEGTESIPRRYARGGTVDSEMDAGRPVGAGLGYEYALNGMGSDRKRKPAGYSDGGMVERLQHGDEEPMHATTDTGYGNAGEEKIQYGEIDPRHDEQDESMGNAPRYGQQMGDAYAKWSNQDYQGGMSRQSRFKYSRGGRVERGFAQALRKKMAYGGNC